jgi:hypothetical protein
MLSPSISEMAQWYYGENGQQIGPLDESAIRTAIGEGRVNPHTLIWREGMPSWQPLAQVPELSVPGGTPVYYGPTTASFGIRNSGLAIASMICGIVGLMLIGCIFGIGGIPAVICGHMALHSIANSPVPLAGRGMAISGLVMGYLQILVILGVSVMAIASAFK